VDTLGTVMSSGGQIPPFSLPFPSCLILQPPVLTVTLFAAKCVLPLHLNIFFALYACFGQRPGGYCSGSGVLEFDLALAVSHSLDNDNQLLSIR